MKVAKRSVLRVCACVLVTLVAATTGRSQATQPAGSSATATAFFERLKALKGEWEGTFEWTGARTGKGAMRAQYYVTGFGSAVVENLTTTDEPLMTTVYHRDGEALRMTHFCAAANQPRLKATQLDAATGSARFSFVDATNLSGPNAAHVSGFEIRLLDEDRIEMTFTFRAGEKLSYEHIKLRRVSAVPSPAAPAKN